MLPRETIGRVMLLSFLVSLFRVYTHDKVLPYIYYCIGIVHTDLSFVFNDTLPRFLSLLRKLSAMTPS